jgi:hypothetical protein
MILEASLAGPACGTRRVEQMSTDVYQFFYTCPSCDSRPRQPDRCTDSAVERGSENRQPERQFLIAWPTQTDTELASACSSRADRNTSATGPGQDAM